MPPMHATGPFSASSRCRSRWTTPRSSPITTYGCWSVAVAPEAQGRGIGNRLLAIAEARARELGRGKVRLYTGEKLTGNIAWYERHGFARERIEDLGDRRLVHMMKRLGD